MEPQEKIAGVATCSNRVATPAISCANRRISTNETLEIEREVNVSGLERTGHAGGGIRTLNPLRGLVFETSAYTIPPRRPEMSF